MTNIYTTDYIKEEDIPNTSRFCCMTKIKNIDPKCKY